MGIETTMAQSGFGNQLQVLGDGSLATVIVPGAAISIGGADWYQSESFPAENNWFYGESSSAQFSMLQSGRVISNVSNQGDPSFSQLPPLSLWPSGSVSFSTAGFVPALGGWAYHQFVTIIIPYCKASCLALSGFGHGCSRRVVDNGRFPNYFVVFECPLPQTRSFLLPSKHTKLLLLHFQPPGQCTERR